MRFIMQPNEANNEQKLLMVRKKYYRNILQYNQSFEQEKKINDHKYMVEANQKISRMNQQAQQLLENQIIAKQNQKFMQQQLLKKQYQRQIQEKKEQKIKQKQIDKKFLKLREESSQKDSLRRIQDLLKIYDRKSIKSTINRRVKTQNSQYPSNPEFNQYDSSPKSYQKQALRLPPLDSKQNDTFNLKQKPQQYSMPFINKNKKQTTSRFLF